MPSEVAVDAYEFNEFREKMEREITELKGSLVDLHASHKDLQGTFQAEMVKRQTADLHLLTAVQIVIAMNVQVLTVAISNQTDEKKDAFDKLRQLTRDISNVLEQIPELTGQE